MKNVKIIQSDYDQALYFLINENLLGYILFDEVIYIPLGGSKYSDMELFNYIDNKLMNLRPVNSQVCIFGDM